MRNSLWVSQGTAESARVRDLFRYSNVRSTLLNDPGEEVYQFISHHIPLETERTMVMKTRTVFNVYTLSDHFFHSLVNLWRINDISNINQFIASVNEKLPQDGLFICCAETKNERKQRILRKYPPVLSYMYYTVDFVFKRVVPKLPITGTIYRKLTGCRNQVLSRTEILGRLYSCGFRWVDEKSIKGKTYFVMQKTAAPDGEAVSSYGPICRMKRIGRFGKPIVVFKFRTMHPYAEFLQEFVYQRNKLREGGKFRNDFRISTIGRFMRKYWIDEIPMLYNLIKGDIKLVGVRPLSKQYLSLYSEEVRNLRLKHKPGLIPPFYADLPKTFEEILESEKRYLLQFEKNPRSTDLKYLLKSLKQILFNRARSN
jgi:lipopolysaccharide/colanic/teichoic acid biosynthesis glycosyltransferase